MYQKLIVCVGLLSSVAVSDAFAVDVLINFERASNPRAVEGAFATDLYADVGVRFPTSPRIKRNDLIAGQGLAQSADERCPGPLEIAIDSALGVRAVRLDVINRHMKYYAVEAFAGTDPVARSQYFPGDIPPLPDRSRRVSLEAAAGAPDITRVVVDPPADCFDWAQIDNLTLDARNPPSVTNYVWVAAYEITQGVMPALTYLPDSGRVSRPESRLMAAAAYPELSTKRLPFITERQTVARFYLASRLADIPRYAASLRVNITKVDGSRSSTTLTENTVPVAAAPSADEPVVRRMDPALAAEDVRRTLVARRGRIDESHDFVIPAPALRNAATADLTLFSPEGRQLAWVQVNFEGPFTMAMNFWRVRGMGPDIAIGGPVPRDPIMGNMQAYLGAVYPVSGPITFRDRGVLPTSSMGTATSCFSYLRTLAAAALGTGPPGAEVSYWSNIFVVQNSPPDCSGLGFYNTLAAMVKPTADMPAHEVGHNIGLNHVTNLHGESAMARRDWEDWPYSHGSIGAVDETRGYYDGVYGVATALVPPAPDFVTSWGTWQLGPIAPCSSTASASLFPQCALGDGQLVHDFMSYGRGGSVPIFNTGDWVSDINYYRIYRFLQECTALDPPHRFAGPGSSIGAFTDPSGGCRAARPATVMAGTAGGAFASAAFTTIDALVITGVLSEENRVEDVRVIRKPIPEAILKAQDGPYELSSLDPRGQQIAAVKFRALKAGRFHPAPGQPPTAKQPDTFMATIPHSQNIRRLDINFKDKRIFSRTATKGAPTITLDSPTGGEHWKEGKQTVSWRVSDPDGDRVDVLVLLSEDAGLSWQPVGLMDGKDGSLEVDVADLPKTATAMVYVSASDGLNTSTAQSKRAFVIGPKPPQGGVHGSSFDGEWEVTATASQGCVLQSWKNRLTIKGTQIVEDGTPRGVIAADGSFQYSRPAPANPSVVGPFTGQLAGDGGKGTYRFPPACTGSIILRKM